MSMDGAPLAPILELRSVRASSGGYEILRGVSLAVGSGDRVAVMGPAGSGKSTLLKVAAGLAPPDEGAAFFDGRDIAALDAREELRFRSVAGFAFQDGALWENQTVLANLSLPLRVHRPTLPDAEVDRRALETLARLGYHESAAVRPAELSIGERKLASIARALVLDPEIVFLDDPTGHLDEDARERVYDIVDGLAAAGRTVLAVTNNSDFALRFARKLAVVAGGSLAYYGTMEAALGGAELEPAARAVAERLKRRRGRGAEGEGA